MYQLLIVCLFGLAFGAHNGGINLPHGHELKVLVDGAFDRLDHSPKDGEVTMNEYDILVQRDDSNNDSCVSNAEFKAHVMAQSQDVADKIYSHFDSDKDDCLDVDELNSEFHHVDKDGNGLIEKHEFEHYYTQLLKHLYGSVH